MRIKPLLILSALCLGLASCESEFTPRPRGHMHIALPDHAYALSESDCPFQFEMSTHALRTNDPLQKGQPCWFGIEYPKYKAKIHVSYLPINGNLPQYLEDVRTLTNKHISKASGIEERAIILPNRNLYGMRFDISGTSTASPIQFFVTDSTQHFLRAALYFNVAPNNDSLAPVIEYISQDIDHMLSTFVWKK